MAGGQLHYAEHTIAVSAAPEVAYGVIADVTAWPYFFEPTIHAERVAGDHTSERIRIWAMAKGEVKTWTSRRWFDRGALRVRFRQETPPAPVASMGGEWIMRPGPDGGTLVVLKHDFSAVDGDREQAEWVREVVDRNSTAELASVKEVAERHSELADLVFSFEDTVDINGPASRVYDFIYRCQDWPERLPHVTRLELQEDTPGLQVMEMDTRAPDGDLHTTKSVRVCFPTARIVYKQTVVPKIMTAHTGEWRFLEDGNEVRAVSRHTVMIKPEAVADVLGADSTLEQARRRVREVLGANSLTTLHTARAYAENGHA